VYFFRIAAATNLMIAKKLRNHRFAGCSNPLAAVLNDETPFRASGHGVGQSPPPMPGVFVNCRTSGPKIGSVNE
jgi:hypothetical protein